MKRSHLWIITALLLVSCGGGDDGAGPGGGGNNNTPDPVPTAAGTPDGAPTNATIGAAGGSVTSSDGLLTVNIPAGALASDTDIAVQPLTNTAWGGVGAGYRLTPDGLTFAVPVELEFSLEDSLLEGTDTSFVDVAVQRDDGVWGVLKHRSLDWGAGSLTCTTTHFSDYSMIEGVQIRPASATLSVSEPITLKVRFCSRETISDPIDNLVALVISCDEGLVPLGTFRNWSVNGAVGGNSTVGRVSPTTGTQVIYTAPAVAPNPNTVAVSVQTTFQGRTALLVSNITIGGGGWDGQITSLDANGNTVTSAITWSYVGEYGTQLWYAPSGPILYTLGPGGDCAFVSLIPNAFQFEPADGIMTIDYGVDPPAVLIGIGTYWDAEHCYQCPDTPVQCGTIGLAAVYYLNDVVIGDNLDLIEGLGHEEDGITYTYTFNKVP